MPIVRPTITDDTGSGLDGTGLTAAFWTDLFNRLDTALLGTVQHDATYNDASAHALTGTVNNRSGRLIIGINSDSGTVIPFYPNGGAGVAYRHSILDPDTGWIYNSTTISFSFQDGGAANTYTVSFSSSSGIATVTRTAGTTAFRVVLIVDALAP